MIIHAVVLRAFKGVGDSFRSATTGTPCEQASAVPRRRYNALCLLSHHLEGLGGVPFH